MARETTKWPSNDDQIIKSRLPDGRRAKFTPSVVGLSYDGRELKVIWEISVMLTTILVLIFAVARR